MNCIRFSYAPQQDTNKFNICICLFCLALNVRIPRNHFQLPGEEVYFHYVSYYSINVRALLKHTLEYYTAQCRQFAFRWHIKSALNLCYWLLTIPAYSSRTPSAQKDTPCVTLSSVNPRFTDIIRTKYLVSCDSYYKQPLFDYAVAALL
jgi:hypothetical protein